MADDPTVAAGGDPAPGQAGNDPEPKEPDPKDPPKDPEPKDPPREPSNDPGDPGPKDPKPKDPEPGNDPPKDPDWRESIEDPKLKEFAGRFDSPADVAKTALEFRQKLSNAVSLPGKKATEEEIAEFNKKLGVPEKPEDYEINVPDDLPEGVDKDRFFGDLDEFKKTMHEAGARPQEVQATVDWYVKNISGEIERMNQTAEENYAEAEASLRKEWGNDYDANVEHAKRASKQFGDEDFQDLLGRAVIDGKSVGNHPSFLKAFAKIGRRIGEGGLQIAMGEEEKQSTQQKMDDLTAEAHDAMNRGDRMKADRLFKERDDIAQKFYGAE